MTLLVTGAAGFIGFHFCLKRLAMGDTIIAVDDLNDYYDVKLKLDRLALLQAQCNFIFVKMDIADGKTLNQLFDDYPITKVVNLAAQAGVRYSLENPLAYVNANCVGFTNILEACRKHTIEHLVYASSSSVYGANSVQPFSEGHGVDHPMSIYAATKRYNELAAHSYSNLYGLPTSGLRFFTVYGPWGRPDMAFFKFTKNILEDKAIDVYNNGQLVRDFTYIDDIVEGMSRVLEQPAKASSDWQTEQVNTPDASYSPFALFNIGNGKPVQLMDYIKAIENAIGKQAKINFMPMQDGDVYATCADVSSLKQHIGYRPQVNVDEGMANFINWYKNYYSTKKTVASDTKICV